MKFQTILIALPFAVLVVGGCGNDVVTQTPQDESLSVIAVAEPASFAPGSEITVAVEVVNSTESAVEFGMGSSTCQFLAVVRYGGEDRGMPVHRFCTPDMAIWSLDPDECRTESWTWNGDVVVDGEVVQLPPGVYELRGVAGEFKGLPFSIEIVK